MENTDSRAIQFNEFEGEPRLLRLIPWLACMLVWGWFAITFIRVTIPASWVGWLFYLILIVPLLHGVIVCSYAFYGYTTVRLTDGLLTVRRGTRVLYTGPTEAIQTVRAREGRAGRSRGGSFLTYSVELEVADKTIDLGFSKRWPEYRPPSASSVPFIRRLEETLPHATFELFERNSRLQH